MKVQIDQSQKVEETNKDTFIGFSNDINHVIRIPAKIKRQLKQEFRELGKPELFTYRVFSAGICLLIKDYLRKIDMIVVDEEYIGRARLIRDMLQEMLKRMRRKEPRIYFDKVGKKKVHKLVYGAMKKKKADRTLRIGELRELLFRKPKSRSA